MRTSELVESRLAARLDALPRPLLVELTAMLGCMNDPDAAASHCCAHQKNAARGIADAFLARHQPISCSLVEQVLMQPDIATLMLGPLEIWHDQAASVNSAWRDVWKATDAQHRGRQQAWEKWKGMLIDRSGGGRR